MANTKKLATLQNTDKTIDIYPITAAAAVYANDGETLEKKINNIISIEKIWENMSPTSIMTEQNITLNHNLLNYQGFLLITKDCTDGTRVLSNLIYGKDLTLCKVEYFNDTLTRHYYRDFSINKLSNTFQIGTAYYKDTNGNSNIDNVECIPIYLFGLKGAK